MHLHNFNLCYILFNFGSRFWLLEPIYSLCGQDTVHSVVSFIEIQILCQHLDSLPALADAHASRELKGCIMVRNVSTDFHFAKTYDLIRIACAFASSRLTCRAFWSTGIISPTSCRKIDITTFSRFWSRV